MISLPVLMSFKAFFVVEVNTIIGKKTMKRDTRVNLLLLWLLFYGNVPHKKLLTLTTLDLQ